MTIVQAPDLSSARSIDGPDAAEILATAIYKCSQKLGIANADHSHLSVAQCLHLLDCIGGTAVPNGFDTESRWTKEHVQHYPRAAAELLNRLLGHEPPQFTSSHKTPYALPVHVIDDIRRYGNECVAFGRAEAIPQGIKP